MKKFALLGQNHQKSLSPKLHRFWYDLYAIEADYQLISLQGSPAEQFQYLQENFNGINITMPYKTLLIPFADELHEHVRMTGAMNTLVFEQHKSYAYNTDIDGLTQSLNLLQLSQKKALVLGSGASAGSTVCALHQLGFDITVSSRNEEKGRLLTKKFPCAGWSPWLTHQHQNLWINATAVELNEEEYPAPIAAVEAAFDLRYYPAQSAFLRRSNAMQKMNGLHMLIAQAAQSFYLWFHYYPDIAAAQNYLIKELS